MTAVVCRLCGVALHRAAQIWVVHRVVGGPVWCARRWDDERQVLNAGSADELVDCLEEVAAGTEN
jgi:hypothetical protein